ncbi:lipoyl(octanoyl) transferase LipB [Chloroflexota bacterium]
MISLERMRVLKNCLIYDLSLGLTGYRSGLRLQEQLLDSRKRGDTPDVLILLQHPSLFTVGRSGKMRNVTASKDLLVNAEIPVFITNRGGDVTYHGPGQLVGYPVLHLRESGLTVREYVWNLEEVVIRILADFGITGKRIPRLRGVWVKKEKICSLGLRINGAVSMHGFALNVNTDLSYFNYIIPCGISGVSITSLAKLTGHSIEMAGVVEKLLHHFREMFSFNLEYDERISEC